MIDRGDPQYGDVFTESKPDWARWTARYQELMSIGCDRYAAEDIADFEVLGYRRYRYMVRNG